MARPQTQARVYKPLGGFDSVLARSTVDHLAPSNATRSIDVTNMKFLTALLGLAPLVAGHGYVDTARIGGQTIQFYQVHSPSPAPSLRTR